MDDDTVFARMVAFHDRVVMLTLAESRRLQRAGLPRPEAARVVVDGLMAATEWVVNHAEEK